MSNYKQLTVACGKSIWTATFNNPPINLLDYETIADLAAMLSKVEEDSSVKVLVFQSADPDFFIAHYDTSKAAVGAVRVNDQSLWIDFVQRLSRAPIISIAKIRGRTRGVGSEFALACDLRFASRQKAIFAQPEIGIGLVPGGGALEWLPRLVGRSRALEIALSGDDFDADLAERYGWVNRALDDAVLDSFVDRLATRLASFDREALGTVKAQINRFGVPTSADIESSTKMFFAAFKEPYVHARRSKIRSMGYGVRSDLELNFGNYLPHLAP